MQTATRALIRRPSLRLAEGEVTHLVRCSVDVPRAFAQHGAYLDLLRKHGLQLIALPELPEHPDGVFVEDVLVILDGTALLTRPGAESRRGEVDSVAACLSSLGLARQRIVAPATLDGGDVLVLPGHLLVGRSTRTNDAAIAQLAALANSLGKALVGVDVRGALHLKSAVTQLPDGALIAVQSCVDTKLLTSLGYAVHAALEPSAGDVLCLGRTVVLPSDAPKTAAMLQEHGLCVEVVDISELQKLEAGVTCMSVLL